MSDFTISREADKLVVARKPVPIPPETFSGCFVPIATLCFFVFGFFIFILDRFGLKEAYWFLAFVGFTTIIGVILYVREKRRSRSAALPPGYTDEILTFDIDKFVVEHEGLISTFSYRLDARPVLRRSDWSQYVDLIIPCSPLSDYVPNNFHLGWGYYEMSCIEIDEAKRILAALKEHLGTRAPRP